MLATAVQVLAGRRFYRGAWNALRGGGANMDVLVSLGTTAAWSFSVYQMATVHHMVEEHLYFEASAAVITLVLLGKLLEAFKELIKEGLCWFPRLMRWKTSKGEVAPVFLEKSDGYSYVVYGYMNVDTREYYSKESVQWEISAGNRTGTVEQMDANVEAMVRDLQEILRIGAEQKRLWEVYEGR